MIAWRKIFFLALISFCLWQTIPAVVVHADEVPLNFQRAGTYPVLESQEITQLTDDYGIVFLRINSKFSGTARLFWATTYDPQFNQQKSIWFSVKSGTHNYYFAPATQNPNWIGFVKKLIIAPEFDVNALSAENAVLANANLFSLVASGWQEFWGPRGRVIQGFSVNNMPYSTLYGRPFNLYLYWIIGIAALIALAAAYAKKPDWRLAWQKSGHAAIIAALVCWGILTFSTLIDESNQFKGDFNKYAFKSLEEKHAAAVSDFGSEYYPFIKFCEANLPNRAKALFLHSGPNADYPKGRAAYFLYPIDLSSKTPDYLIVYYYDKDSSIIAKEYPGFAVYKKFNDSAYIMKKGK